MSNFSLTGTPENIQKLARAVGLKYLTFGVVSSNLWAELKSDPDKMPSFEVLKKAGLWQDEDRFKKPVWSWLCGPGEDWTVAAANAVQTQAGEVLRISLEVPSGKEMLNCGRLGPIHKTRNVVDVVFVEVNNDTDILAQDVIGLLASPAVKQTAIRMVVWGEAAAIERLKKEQLARLMEPGGVLHAYKTKEVDVMLPKDEAYGARGVGYSNVKRVGLMLSPTNFRTCPSYIVSHTAWTPMFLAHFLHCFDLTRLFLQEKSSVV